MERIGNTATVSLKKDWKPTLTWEKDDLVLKAVPKYDVVTIKKEVLSIFSIHLNLAIVFGFVKPVPGKENTYTLGPTDTLTCLKSPTIVLRYQEIPPTNIPGWESII